MVEYKITDSAMARDSIDYALNYHFTQKILDPRDSFHLAFAILANAEGFVTSDEHFDKLDGVNLTEANLIIYKY